MEWDDVLEAFVSRDLKITLDFHLQEQKTAHKETMAKSKTNSQFALQRQLFARSERVKGIDFHPFEPWILTTLYSGMFSGAWSI